MIKFSQKAWLKQYIDSNTKPRQKAKNNFEKVFFKLMNNEFLGEIIKNKKKYRNIKLASTETSRTYLVSERSYHTQSFSKKLYWQ